MNHEILHMKFYINTLPNYSVPCSYPVLFIWEFLSMGADRNVFLLFLCTYSFQAIEDLKWNW